MGLHEYEVKGRDGMVRTFQLDDADAARYGERAKRVNAKKDAPADDKAGEGAREKQAGKPANKAGRPPANKGA